MPDLGSVPEMKDRQDVETVVLAFYRAAFEDDLIGHIFTEVAKLDLERHLPIMCDFWETVVFGAGLYHRNALQVHFALNAQHPLLPEHFDRWLELWVTTVDAHFSGEAAERAKLQATRIAGAMSRRMSAALA